VQQDCQLSCHGRVGLQTENDLLYSGKLHAARSWAWKQAFSRPAQRIPAIQKESVDSTLLKRGHEVILTETLQTVIDDVSKFDSLLPRIMTGLEQSVRTFKAGNLSSSLNKWKSITSDKEIIDMETGTTIDFAHIPVQSRPPAIQTFSDSEVQIMETEPSKLLNSKGVI
jgi:hypothetical protein